MRGTLLNTATVACGALLGVAVGRGVPVAYDQIAVSGIGLVVIGLGVKLFLQSKNVLVVAAAIAAGGVIGLALGLSRGLEALGTGLQSAFGGSGRFSEAVITPTLLFCIGPMTLIGCLEDGLERKIDLLAVKSTIDGFSAFFLAATLGAGVLLSAVLLLLIQGALTLGAKSIRPLASDEALLGEVSGAGGILLLAIGLGLLELKKLPVADYLPALILAPLFVAASRKLPARRARCG
jgi:uncharacterized membrane protein YqgA involved in biofilm formation